MADKRNSTKDVFEKKASPSAFEADPNDNAAYFSLLLGHNIDLDCAPGFKDAIDEGLPVLYSYNQGDQTPEFFCMSDEGRTMYESQQENGNYGRLRIVDIAGYEVLPVEQAPVQMVEGMRRRFGQSEAFPDGTLVTILHFREFAGQPRDLTVRSIVLQ